MLQLKNFFLRKQGNVARVYLFLLLHAHCGLMRSSAPHSHSGTQPPFCSFVIQDIKLSGSLGQELRKWHMKPFCKINFKILFVYFGCAGSLLSHRLFSRCWEWGLLSSCGVQASHCGSISCCRAWALGTGLIVVAPGLCCSMACGIFPAQGSNPCLLHWQTDSLPLSHQ